MGKKTDDQIARVKHFETCMGEHIPLTEEQMPVLADRAKHFFTEQAAFLAKKSPETAFSEKRPLALRETYALLG